MKPTAQRSGYLPWISARNNLIGMKTGILSFLVLLLAGVPYAPAQDSPACKKARLNLELLIGRLDHTCRVDSDCTGVYIRADSCKPAAELNKNALSLPTDIESLQAAVVNACRKELSQQAACSPIPYNAQCFESRCREKPFERVKASSNHPAYKYAYTKVTCSGNDWLVTKLYLTAKPQGCGIKGDLLEFDIIPETEHVEHPAGGGPPQLLIKTGLNGTTFFGPKRTRLAAAWQAKKTDAHFGDASRCSSPDFSTCITAVSGELVIDDSEKGSVRGHYELHFPDGSIETGTFTNPQNPCPNAKPELCG